jgi:hypothetical protein
MRAECRPFGNRPIYYSVRADSGIDHSKENPSFIAGAVGGRGSARLGWPEAEVSNPTLRPFSRTDFVRVSIGNRVTAGGSQARRGPTMVLLHVIGRIIRLRSDHAPAILMGSGSAWQHKHRAPNHTATVVANAWHGLPAMIGFQRWGFKAHVDGAGVKVRNGSIDG